MSITKFRKSLSRYLKPVLIAIAGVFFISCFTMYGSNILNKQPGQDGDKYALRVNGEKISAELYGKLYSRWFAQMKTQQDRDPTASEEALQKMQLVRTLVQQTLARQAAEKEGIRVGRREVRDEVDRRVKADIDDLRQKIVSSSNQTKKPSRAEQDRMVEQYLRMVTRDQTVTTDSYMEQMRRDFDPDMVRAGLMVSKLDDALRRRVRMTDKELIDSYRQVTARQIVISTGAMPEAQARRKADEVLKKLREGGDFAALARQFSDDPSKQKGGLFPAPVSPTIAQYLGVGPAVSKVLFSLKPGQISDVIRGENGLVILKVDSEKLSLPKDFEKNKKTFMAQQVQYKQQQVTGDFYNSLLKTAKIEIGNPGLKAYWLLSSVGGVMAASPKEAQGIMAGAAAELEKALNADPRNGSALYMLAQIYRQTGQSDKAIKALENALEVRRDLEGGDFRMTLGDLYAAKGDKKRALEQYKLAGDVGYADYGIHQQLIAKYKSVGHPELAAKEQQWVSEVDARRAAANAQAGGGTPPAPVKATPIKTERRPGT